MAALLVPLALRSRWRMLDPSVRAYLDAFLTLDATAGTTVRITDVPVPPTFQHDLQGGAPRLRAAFPDLSRELLAIEPRDRLVVRIACRGVQAGSFFGFMLATGRAAHFEERHALTVRDGRIVEDLVSIDVGGIIRQLASADLGVMSAP